jgi:hypothetical protein
MFRLFAMLLALPWPVMALISAGLFWLAQDSHQRVTAFEAEKAQALQAGAPEPVSFDAFTEADIHAADEVHVAAWLGTDYNYELTKQRKGTDTVRRMYVLFGPGDAETSKVARGIVLLSPGQVDGFIGHLLSRMYDPLDARMPFHLNGTVDTSPELSDMVADAFAEQGLTKAEDFVVIEPFLEGREAALAPDPDAPMRVATVFGGLGALAALLALGKLLTGRGRKKRREDRANAELERAVVMAAAARPVVAPLPTHSEPTNAAPVAANGQRYATVPTPPPTAWSPLEAVMAKQAATVGATRSGGYGFSSGLAAGAPSGMGADQSLPKRDGAGAGLRRVFRAPTKVVGALVFYFAVYLAFGHLTPPTTMNSVPEGGMVAKVMEGLFGFAPAEAEGEEGAATLPQGNGGAQRTLPQVDDTPPSPKNQVSEDIAAGMTPAEAVRRAIAAEFPDETGPSGPVFLSTGEDQPAAQTGLVEQLRDLVPQGWGGMDPAEVSAAVMGGGLWKGPAGIAVLLALGSVFAAIGLAVARRSRQRATATRGDPWARISDRLQ